MSEAKRVFLCHNSEDKVFVRKISAKLRERSFLPWLDEEKLQGGDSWLEKIQEEIRRSDVGIVFVGRSGIEKWQKVEFEALCREKVDRTCPLIPVILSDYGEGAPELPAFLDGFHRVDFRKRTPNPLEKLVLAIGGRSPSTSSEDSESNRSSRPTVEQPAPERSGIEKRLDQELQELRNKQEELALADEPTADIAEKIRELDRLLRDGIPLCEGDILCDRFKLSNQIGQGGFGTVWKAWDRHESRIVAIKVLHGQYSRDESHIERFFRGAEEMARLGHPEIVRVVEKKAEDEGHYFFVMEYVPGKDLHSKIVDKEISRADCLEIVLQVGDALAYAHEKKVIHRDVKPGNILIDERSGRAKLTDFDLVQTKDTEGKGRTGTFGTMIYAAPEVMYSAEENISVQSDVYSLGMTAVFALYGKKELPVHAMCDTWDFVRQLDADGAVRRVLAQAVSWDKSERPSTVETFCRELRQSLRPDRSSREDLFRWIETPHDGRVDLWREIPAGEFLMGSPDGRGLPDEHPQHRVRIDRPFRISAVPITNAQFAVFEPMHKQRFWSGVSSEDLAFHPVVNITLDQAIDFCRWLAETFPWAQGARLATEEEWEYACRAGTTTCYWSGQSDEDLQRVGWYEANAGDRTHRVGEKPANPWGLYDVHGNVWEWTASLRSDYAARSGETRVDPLRVVPTDVTTAKMQGLVIRGGSFEFAADCSCSSHRAWGRMGVILKVQGFRVVLPGAVDG